jgi:hypothetical protein
MAATDTIPKERLDERLSLLEDIGEASGLASAGRFRAISRCPGTI